MKHASSVSGAITRQSDTEYTLHCVILILILILGDPCHSIMKDKGRIYFILGAMVGYAIVVVDKPGHQARKYARISELQKRHWHVYFAHKY